ncbi:Protein FAM19A5 [Cricetulus griseus]|uniref:Protein FAM19A5 n=1 Tax=Cricetulus griseus TaxID=10029 RepID=G3ILN7_CRIGR|nr:Protein FAM19A5 [Cricetulus griseus]
MGSRLTESSLRISLVEPAVVDPILGQLAAGTCEIVTLDRDSSQPRRTIARQTARCACRKGQIAGTTRARPACVDGKSSQTSGGTSGY